MTDPEFYTNAGYLANPNRETNIQVEMPQPRRAKFIVEYATLTNNFLLPLNTSIAPYYVWAPGANKRGLEARVYFISNNNLPQSLFDILEPRKINNRPGYKNWTRRFSKIKNVFPLLEIGFVLGPVQDVNRIRALVPPNFINDFNIGFEL